MTDNNEKTLVIVDGEQVFTALYVFSQQMAQNCRIYRVKTMTGIGICLGIFNLIVELLLILC